MTAKKLGYTKSNATYESNHVLNIIAAERAEPVYKILDDILRTDFPDYFRRIGC